MILIRTKFEELTMSRPSPLLLVYKAAWHNCTCVCEGIVYALSIAESFDVSLSSKIIQWNRMLKYEVSARLQGILAWYGYWCLKTIDGHKNRIVRRNEDAVTNAPTCEIENIEHGISPWQLCLDQVRKWPICDKHKYRTFMKLPNPAQELVNMDKSSFYKMCWHWRWTCDATGVGWEEMPSTLARCQLVQGQGYLIVYSKHRLGAPQHHR